MLTIQLIRHAACDHVGRRIAGRAPGIRLNARGQAEAEALARMLEASARGTAVVPGGPPGALYAGPLERAVETAEILGRRLGLSVEVAPGLDELDFGTWTGLPIEELERDPCWQAFNRARGATRIPGGEHMADAVNRAVAVLATAERRLPGGTVAAVTHGDIIRGVLLQALGMPLDAIHRLEIVAPASISVVRLSGGVPCEVVAVSWTVPDASGLVQNADDQAG